MIFRSTATACICVSLFLPSWVHAQDAAAPSEPATVTASAFSYELGHAENSREGVSATYSVRATQPFDSKLASQKIQLERNGSSPGVTTHRTLVVNTGKYKTVGADERVHRRGLFAAFYRRRPRPGQELGKIGDVRYGGEIRFVAASADQLDYHVVSSTGQDNAGRFDGADVQAFLSILAGTPRS